MDLQFSVTQFPHKKNCPERVGLELPFAPGRQAADAREIDPRLLVGRKRHSGVSRFHHLPLKTGASGMMIDEAEPNTMNVVHSCAAGSDAGI